MVFLVVLGVVWVVLGVVLEQIFPCCRVIFGFGGPGGGFGGWKGGRSSSGKPLLRLPRRKPPKRPPGPPPGKNKKLNRLVQKCKTQGKILFYD